MLSGRSKLRSFKAFHLCIKSVRIIKLTNVSKLLVFCKSYGKSSVASVDCCSRVQLITFLIFSISTMFGSKHKSLEEIFVANIQTHVMMSLFTTNNSCDAMLSIITFLGRSFLGHQIAAKDSCNSGKNCN